MYLRFPGCPVVLDVELSVSARYQNTRRVLLRARRLLLLLLLAAESGGARCAAQRSKLHAMERKESNDFVPIRTPENPAAPKTPPLENALFNSRNPMHMYLPAATINTKGAMSHMPIVQPT